VTSEHNAYNTSTKENKKLTNKNICRIHTHPHTPV